MLKWNRMRKTVSRKSGKTEQVGPDWTQGLFAVEYNLHSVRGASPCTMLKMKNGSSTFAGELRANRPTYGTFMMLSSAWLARTVAGCGFDVGLNFDWAETSML